MRCHSVGCGTKGQIQLRTRSATQSPTARSHDAVIRVYDAYGNLIETHEHKGDFIAPIQLPARKSTLSETIRQRPMRAGCWRFLHANDDKVTACGFRNDVRSRN